MCFGGGQQASAPVNPAPYPVQDSALQVTSATAPVTATQAGQTPSAPTPPPQQPAATNDSFPGLQLPGGKM